MESVSILASSIDVRHEPTVLPPMSTPSPHKPLKRTSSLRPDFLSSPNIRTGIAGPSRHMISSPLRTCTPVTARVPPIPPIDTANTTPNRIGSQPLERVPTEPASAPPARQQPTAEELAVFGIKVRDFAFEPSVLPRVPTVQRPYTFFQNLKRPLEEMPEDLEARKKNEARRLEFNSPRRRDEGPEEREAKRLAFSSPRIKGSLENGISQLGGSTSAQPFEWPEFSRSGTFSRNSLSTSAEAGPSLSRSPGSTTRTPLRRQSSQSWISGGPSTTPLAHRFFANSYHSQWLSSALSSSRSTFISHVSNEQDPRTSNSFRQQSLPRLDLEAFSQAVLEQQSQSQPESQFESQSQDISNSQIPPGLSTSQADSEMDSDVDDEEYVKTPLVTPHGSLIFDDDDHLHLNSHNDTDADALISDVDNTGGHDNNDARTTVGSTEDNSIVNSSTLPESQVAELLAPVETGPDEDVSVSQMGLLESQDLLSSQPAWQQQSQSQYPSQYPSQLLTSNELEQEKDGDGDVEMPESQPEGKEDGDGEEESASTPTLSPKASFVRTLSSTTLHPSRPNASACSNHAVASPHPRPLTRVESSASLSRRSSHSLLRRSTSLTSLVTKGRSRSNSRINTSSSALASQTSPGRTRYNLRTPSAKKAKLFGASPLHPLPSFSAGTSRTRSHSRTQSAPALRNSKKAVHRAAVRRSKSAVQTRRRSRGKDKGEADVVMGDEGSITVNAEAAS